MPMVVALKTQTGVVMAANPIACYGSTLFNENLERFTSIGSNFVFACSGDYSDFTEVSEKIKEMWYKESVYGGVEDVNVVKYANYIQNLCYHRRNKVDPFLIDGTVAGFDNEGQPRLYYVDQFGTFFEKPYVATGFGNYMVPPVVGGSQWRV